MGTPLFFKMKVHVEKWFSDLIGRNDDCQSLRSCSCPAVMTLRIPSRIGSGAEHASQGRRQADKPPHNVGWFVVVTSHHWITPFPLRHGVVPLFSHIASR